MLILEQVARCIVNDCKARQDLRLSFIGTAAKDLGAERVVRSRKFHPVAICNSPEGETELRGIIEDFSHEIAMRRCDVEAHFRVEDTKAKNPLGYFWFFQGTPP